MPQLGELLALDGKLAQFRGDRVLPDRPVKATRYAVSNVDAGDYDVIGKVPWSAGNHDWSGTVRHGWGGDIMVDTSGWKLVTVEAPIAKPRDGGTYRMVWSEGYSYSPGWRREEYPRCYDCDKRHADGKCKG